jgi:hypothetical protein
MSVPAVLREDHHRMIWPKTTPLLEFEVLLQDAEMQILSLEVSNLVEIEINATTSITNCNPPTHRF